MDLAMVQHALVHAAQEICPGIRSATLAEAQHTAHPYGIAFAFPQGQRAYIQLRCSEYAIAAAPPEQQTTPAAPAFPPDAAHIETADIERLVEAVLHEVGPAEVRTERYSTHPSPGRGPYGVHASYPGGIDLWAVPFLLLAPGQTPHTRHQWPDPAPDRF